MKLMPTTGQLHAAVDAAVEESRRASAELGGFGAFRGDIRQPAAAWRAMPVASLFLMSAGEPQAPALARLDELAAQTSRRLKEIWALRALVKRLRRLRRQVRKSDVLASRKAELRAALSEAEDSLLTSLTTPPRQEQ
jgi:hypothetical protein